MSTERIVQFGTAQTLDEAQGQRTGAAPFPTESTLKHRKNVFIQIGRFIVFNVRFMATFLGEKLAGDVRIEGSTPSK